MRTDGALAAVIEAARECNRYLEEAEPWHLRKDPSARARLDTVLYTAAEVVRIVSGLLLPAIPRKARDLRECLGLAKEHLVPTWGRLETWGLLIPGTRVRDPGALFPRIEGGK